jgi:hypothetical protein
MVKYTNITQNTHVQSWTVTEIMVRENCGLLTVPHIVPISWHALLVYVLECGVISPHTSSWRGNEPSCWREFLTNWATDCCTAWSCLDSFCNTGEVQPWRRVITWTSAAETSPPFPWAVDLYGPEPEPVKSNSYVFYVLEEFSHETSLYFCVKNVQRLLLWKIWRREVCTELSGGETCH